MNDDDEYANNISIPGDTRKVSYSNSISNSTYNTSRRDNGIYFFFYQQWTTTQESKKVGI